MENPFKYGVLVEDAFFTDRKAELEKIKRHLAGPNHLIMISPRRYGKSSLIAKALQELKRPAVVLNLQMAVSEVKLAAMIHKAIYRLHPMQKIKDALQRLRIVPTLSFNPTDGTFEATFAPNVDGQTVLEDAVDLLETLSDPENCTIVVLDEFQEVLGLGNGIDKRLRAQMQLHKNVNYVFLGSQESMMTAIFEQVKSPFYHFGLLMHLKKIPRDDFELFLTERLQTAAGDKTGALVKAVLDKTGCHPYYTQQLASIVWERLVWMQDKSNVFEDAVAELVEEHDLDYERLWLSFNVTQRRILQGLAQNRKADEMTELATSTRYDSLAKLAKNGYVIREQTFEIEDPFFKDWIAGRAG